MEIGGDKEPVPLSPYPSVPVKYTQAVLKDRFHLLLPDEVLILVTAYHESNVNNVRLQELTHKSARDINKLLSDLVEEGLLLPQGTGRGTSYVLSEIFVETGGNNETEYDKETNSGNNSDCLGNNDGNSSNNDLARKDDIENNEILMEISKPAREKKRLNPVVLREIILSLCTNRFLPVAELSYYLRRNADGLRRNHIKKLAEMNRIELRYPNTPNHSDQAYKSVSRD